MTAGFYSLITETSHRRHPEPQVFWVGYYTELILGLLKAGAKVVALDVIPADADDSACRAFNQMVFNNPHRVILGYYFRPRAGQRPAGVFPPEGMLPLLRRDGLGSLNLPRDQDGVVRRITVFPFQLSNRDEEGMYFASRIAEAYTGRQFELASHSFNGNDLPIATADESIWINYHGRPGHVFPSDEFAELLDTLRSRGPKALVPDYQDKVVIIGSATDADQDLIDSPLRGMGPGNEQGTRGVEVQAQIVNTVLQGDYLRPVSKSTEAICIFVGSVLLALLSAYSAQADH